MPDIAEQICLAVDQIVTERIKGIKYDSTITATIVSDKDAKDYRYICSNGSSQFVAFSKDTSFKAGDSVQVTIPNNDYDQQKIIIGKYVAKDDKPYVFVQPFETFIDVSANLIKTSISESLLANESYDKLETENNGKTTYEKVLWSKYFEEGHKGFDRLGIKGQFRSWINSLKTVEGDYGYRLQIFSSNGEMLKENQVLNNVLKLYNDCLNSNNIDYFEKVLTQSDLNSWYEKLMKDTVSLEGEETYQSKFIDAFRNEADLLEKQKMLLGLLSTQLIVTNLYLNSEEMYGNPYNFQNYFEQEKVFDISSLDNIIQMNLYFYQESGTFKDELGYPIPYRFDTETLRPDNLFTKDAYICLGYDLSAFDKEQAILYSMDSDFFLIKDIIEPQENWKTIRLRWLHEFESGNIGVVSEATTDVKPKVNETDEEGYEIRWYQYTLGAPSADEYSGAFWKRLPKAQSQKDADGNYIELLEDKEIGNEISYVSALSDFNCTLRPRTNQLSEQVKVIILFNGNIIRSNILTFTNQDENGVSSSATASTVAGLQLWCEDGSYGNYFVYGQNNKILETEEFSRNKILTLQAKFADASLLAEEYDVDKEAPLLTEAKEIVWEFPLSQTMIEVEGFNYDYAKSNIEGNAKYIIPNGYLSDASVTINTVKNTIQIKRLGDPSNGYTIKPEQNYKIKDFYNQTAINNTITCSVLKNNMLYTAIKEFSFGLRGTTGAEATLILDFDNNKTALTANLEEESIKITAHLYDSAYQEIDFHDANYNLTCEWNWSVYYQDFESLSYTDVKKDLGKYTKLFLEDQIADVSTQLDQAKVDKNQALEEELTAQLDHWNNLMDYVERRKSFSADEEGAILSTLDNLKPDIHIKAGNDPAFCDIHFEQDQTDPNVCHIKHSKKLLSESTSQLKNYLQVIQVTVKNWQEERNNEFTQGEKMPCPFNSDLIANKTIPIRYDARFRNITGPVDIIYDSSGNVNYTKSPYEMWGRNDLTAEEIENDFYAGKEWLGYEKDKFYVLNNGVYSLSTEEFDENVAYYQAIDHETVLEDGQIINQIIYTLVYSPDVGGIVSKLNEAFPLGLTWKIFNPFGERADLIGSFKTGNNGVQINNVLRPAPIYTADAAPYGVRCYADIDGSGKFEVVWIQPLIIAQNRYPSATLNAWDGKTVELNPNEGYIISPAIAAGKKNADDNTFSGVMLGDWSNLNTEASIAKQTGLYGFHHGAQTFAFKEDGTAFIGKSGKGRIIFDGNSGILKSSAWGLIQDGKVVNNGMFLDLDDGILLLQQEPGYDPITLTKETYLPNVYWILKETYTKVPVGTRFGTPFTIGSTTYECTPNTTYYLYPNKVSNLRLNADEYLTYVLAGKLYLQDPPTYQQCTASDEFDSYIYYYTVVYKKLEGAEINKELFDRYKGKKILYVTNDEKTFIDVTSSATFNEQTTYYIQSGTRINGLTDTEFNANKTGYYTLRDYTYTKITASVKNPSNVTAEEKEAILSKYDSTVTYYTEGYQPQQYVANPPNPDKWNISTATDSNLKNGYNYYILQTAWEKSSGAFDPTETYYNYSGNKRYITLSADTDRFPLAIGTNEHASQRKFKVDWDGTCYIEDGFFNGDIEAETGYLENLELRGTLRLNSNGVITAGKDSIDDISSQGFWLSRDGLAVGAQNNYFIATPSYTGFYNNGGALKVSGLGLDLFPKVDTGQAGLEALQGTNEGIIKMGWSSGTTLANPFIRFGNGTVKSDNVDKWQDDAGIVKKYSQGMWIGTHGNNNASDTPDNDADNTVGIFCNSTKGQEAVYRMETIGGQKVYEKVRYARFAPD